LGLDVHDVGDLRGNNKGVLTEGMIFTIEPGLYFSKAAGKIPPMGVRIEDDVLVTRRGCEVLTEGFPKHVKELLSLMNAR
jgi:Xaa-Pro aminopeptidase